MNRLLIYIILSIIIISNFSCVPQKKLKYVQEKYLSDTINIYPINYNKQTTIKPRDQLYIKVFSFDEETYSFFNKMMEGTGNMNQNPELTSYQVNDSGYVKFPFIGNIKLDNLTLEEAEIKIQKKLAGVIDQPTVVVKFFNRSYTIIGEINSPGTYLYSKSRFNIFEAIGQAGDISYYGDRKNVRIIRETNDSIIYLNIDLTNKNIVQSEFYFIETNDIIYIEPLKNKVWGIQSIPGGIGVIMSSISLILVFYSLLK